MSSLKLDMNQIMPQTHLIPEALIEKCAAMSVRTNAIKELTDAMAGLSYIKHVSRYNLYI